MSGIEDLPRHFFDDKTKHTKGITMPTKKSSRTKRKKAPEQVPFGEITWVMNNLTNEQLSDMDATEWTGDHIIGRIQFLVEGGWKISAKWDYYSEAVQVSCIQVEKGRPNAGYAFSARSDDVLDAMKIVVYKHDVVAEGNLSDFAVDKGNIRG